MARPEGALTALLLGPSLPRLVLQDRSIFPFTRVTFDVRIKAPQPRDCYDPHWYQPKEIHNSSLLFSSVFKGQINSLTLSSAIVVAIFIRFGSPRASDSANRNACFASISGGIGGSNGSTTASTITGPFIASA